MFLAGIHPKGNQERFPIKNVGKGDAGKSDGAGAPELFWRGEASKSYDLKKGKRPLFSSTFLSCLTWEVIQFQASLTPYLIVLTVTHNSVNVVT